jgi:multidrug efflux pump subunit AcrB
MGVFAASFLVAPLLNREMVPSQDIGVLLCRLETPVGSSIDFTDSRLRLAEGVLDKDPAVDHYFCAIGGLSGGGGVGGEVNSGIMFVTLAPRESGRIPMQQEMLELRRKLNVIPGLVARIQDMSTQGLTSRGGSTPVEFAVRGSDFSVLARQSERIVAKMREADVFTDVNSDYRIGMPESRIVPDRDRAAALGVSMEDVAQSVNALVGGVTAGRFKDSGRRYDVRARLLSDQRSRPEDLGRLRVRTKGGELVPLSSLVTVDTHPTLLQVTRRGRQRAVTITANVAPGRSQAQAVELAKAIAADGLPLGYGITLSGASLALEETGRELTFALILGVCLAYMILAAQFNSFAHPLSVLIAMPMALTGALVGLWMFDLSLNIYSAIGLILLMGIVKKNSILLVEFTNHRRVLGESREDALLHACPARLRPILMTTLSTLVGALPAALAVGPGSELRQPMAVAVIGGLTVSTLLTLYVVPALYSVLDSVTRRVGSAATIERETLGVLADLQSEDLDRFRHKEPAAKSGGPVAAPSGSSGAES